MPEPTDTPLVPSDARGLADFIRSGVHDDSATYDLLVARHGRVAAERLWHTAGDYLDRETKQAEVEIALRTAEDLLHRAAEALRDAAALRSVEAWWQGHLAGAIAHVSALRAGSREAAGASGAAPAADTPPVLPPFSGEDPRCARCGHHGASTHYRAHGRCLHGTGGSGVGYEPNPRLHRECDRCGHEWDEATVDAATQAAPPEHPA